MQQSPLDQFLYFVGTHMENGGGRLSGKDHHFGVTFRTAHERVAAKRVERGFPARVTGDGRGSISHCLFRLCLAMIRFASRRRGLRGERREFQPTHPEMS